MADDAKDVLDSDPGRRQSLFRGLTGRGGDVSGKAEAGNTEAMLRAAYGTTKRGAIDTKAAAADLGVSQRSVQRWIARDAQRRSAPRGDRLKSLAKKARQAATTQRGRRTAMRDVRQSPRGQRMASRGAQVTITGRQGPSGTSKKYLRQRSIGLSLSADDVGLMWSAYEAGGEKAVSQWLTDHAGDEYLDGWNFESIDDLQMGPR